MKISTALKTGAILVITSAILMSAPSVRAQQPGGLSSPGYVDEVDVVGAGLDRGSGNGEPNVVVSGAKGGAPKFNTPSASQVSASMEFEKWGSHNANLGGRIAGNRNTYIMSYSRTITPDVQAEIIAPYQRLKLQDTKAAEGFSDTELALRKYFVNTTDPAAPTIVASARVFLPTGNAEKGIGTHALGYGPSVLISKPYNNTLGYAGIGYTYIQKYSHLPFPTGLHYISPWYYWAGGATQIKPQWMTQYEVMAFNSPIDQFYIRALIGLRYSITPSMGIQVNYKKELRADGKAETLSIGWSGIY